MYCEYGHGRCTAPDTKCIYWMGTFCEYDVDKNSNHIMNFKNIKRER